MNFQKGEEDWSVYLEQKYRVDDQAKQQATESDEDSDDNSLDELGQFSKPPRLSMSKNKSSALPETGKKALNEIEFEIM